MSLILGYLCRPSSESSESAPQLTRVESNRVPPRLTAFASEPFQHQVTVVGFLLVFYQGFIWISLFLVPSVANNHQGVFNMME
jgi:hypothetical protein